MMNCISLCAVLLFFGVISAQGDGDAPGNRACHPDMCELLKELDAMTAKLKVLETTVRESQNQIKELKDKEKTKVIFSAAVGGPDSAVGPFSAATTLIYKAVKTNIGNAYSPVTGIFTAPVAGVYYFTFFYHAGGEHRSFLVLFKNSQNIADSSDHASSADGADNGGNAVILQLQRGDRVFMRMQPNTHVWGNPSVTTFSGYLITAM